MEPICSCHSFEFIPIEGQPLDFISRLGRDDFAALIAACASAAAGFAANRPHGSRTTLVGDSSVPGLFVLRVVWPGVPRPQLRLLCVRDGLQVLLARGFIQEGPSIPASEVISAEQAILRARRERCEPSEEQTGR